MSLCYGNPAFCNSVMDWRTDAASVNKGKNQEASMASTWLVEAVQEDNVFEVARLLKTNDNSNATCHNSDASACYIAALSDSDTLSLLLEFGADGNIRDRFGGMPLHVAAWAGHARQIAVLLNFPPDLRSKVDDMTPEIEEKVVKIAALTKNLVNSPCEASPKNINFDLKYECKILEKLPIFPRGWTAVHATCASAHPRCLRLLLAAGADVAAHDSVNRTPLDVVGCSYYSGVEINVDDFRTVIQILLNSGAKFTNTDTDGQNRCNTPLHTAVELESLEAIRELLDAGASVKSLSESGKTPMHVCIKKKLKEHLQLLANHKNDEPNPKTAPINIKDIDGCTILHAAIKDSWFSGVRVAIESGADIMIKDKKDDIPLHSAVKVGDINVLQEIINVAKENNIINYAKEDGRTAIFIAVENNQLNCIDLLLRSGAEIKNVPPGKANVLHVAADRGHADVLDLLLNQNQNDVAEMINKVINYKGIGFSPIYFAVLNDHPKCVKMLLSKNASLSVKNENMKKTTALHVAANLNRYVIAKMIIEFDKSTLSERNWEYVLPLHKACMCGNRNIITLLVQNGSSLYEVSSKHMNAFNMIMDNISKPTEFLEELFDSFITCNDDLQERSCRVKVDYTLFTNRTCEFSEPMRVIKSLLRTGNRHGQQRLLLHPLIESYLCLKWKVLLPFFYLALFSFSCFVLSLNVYIVSVFYYKDKKKEVPTFLKPDIWQYVVYSTVIIITFQEIIIMRAKPKRYILSVESWVKFGTLSLSAIIPILITIKSSLEAEWPRLIATVALLLSWLELMLLLSRFPSCGFYIAMFGIVCVKVIKILLVFTFLVIGFALSFMIQFRSSPPFEGPLSAFIKTIVMMTSEFEYEQNFNRVQVEQLAASTLILRIMFVAFLILASIVLMNLMVAVAVNDLSNLEVTGNIKRLQKQIEFLTSLEAIAYINCFGSIIPIRYNITENSIILRPRVSQCKFVKFLPLHIREAIFEKAKLQKNRLEVQIETKTFKEKIDQIHETILRKDENNAQVRLLYDLINQMNMNVSSKQMKGKGEEGS